MNEKKWTVADIPSQKGRNIIITGATSGIGFETAKELSKSGASIVIAARNSRKAEMVINGLINESGNSDIKYMKLDTASLSSIRKFVENWRNSGKQIDVLILNAGISNVPVREETVDGFERQFATNYLGHFALTQLLLSCMKDRNGSRIVMVSSLSHMRATLHFDDLQLHKYNPMTAYSQSKLAILMFALELSRRLRENDSKIAVIPVHPGIASTEITRGGDRINPVKQKITKFLFRVIGQSSAEGAWPALFAATSPDAKSGVYYGPGDRGEKRGNPAPAKVSDYANNKEAAKRLWELSEEMAGFSGFW